MTSIIRSLFKSRKAQKEYETDEQYVVFQPCVRSSSWKRKPTTRFADDCMLPPTAAYHTTSAPKLRKGPQSCPGSNRDDIIDGIPESFRKKHEKRRKYRLDDANHKKFSIDSKFEQGFRQHGSRNDLKTRDGESLSIKLGRSRNSLFDSRSENEECENDIEVGVDDRIAILQQKSLFYMQQWENSERQRIDEQRKQERLELERCSIQNAMGNIAYCMASVQQIEQLKRERDQYKKEMSRYKNKCEKLESRYEKLENLSPNYAAFQSFRNPLQPSAFQAPQFPPEQMSFNLPNQNSLLLSEVPVPLPNVHRPVNCLTNGPQPSHYSISLDFLNNEQLSSRHGGSVNLPMTDTPITFGSEGAGESLVNPTDVSYNRNSSIGKDSDKFSNNVFTLCSYIRIIGMSYAFCALPAMVIERFFATFLLEDYEKKSNLYIGICTVIFQWLIAISVGIHFNKAKRTIEHTAVAIVANSLAVCLNKFNERVNSKYYYEMNRPCYSLSERFQITDNIKSAKMFNKIVFSIGFFNIIVNACLILDNYDIPMTFRNISSVSCDFSILLYGLTVPFVYYSQTESWRKRVAVLMKGCRNPRTSPLKDAFGHNMTSKGPRDETARYFEMLQNQWK